MIDLLPKDLFPLAMFVWGLLVGIGLTNAYLKNKYAWFFTRIKNRVNEE